MDSAVPESILTAEELLGGAQLTQEVVIPPEVLRPGKSNGNEAAENAKIVLKPLTVKDIQLISRAAKDDETLVSSLMVQQAMIKPKLTIAQIQSMHGGLMTFIVEKINCISGLKTDHETIKNGVRSPMVKACVILSKEFGWTPAEISEMTMGQIILYLETLNADAGENI